MTPARRLLLIAIALFTAAGCQSNPTSNSRLQPAELRAGCAQTDITPPVGYRMAGYFYERLSTAVHDPLLAKALVLRQGDERFAWVVCDLCHLSAAAVAQAKALAAKETGIPIDHIAVSATHTHTGPEYFGALYEHLHRLALGAHAGTDPTQAIDYPALLAQRIARAIADADRAAAPAQLAFGQTDQPGLAFNRRYVMQDGTVGWNPGKRNPKTVKPAGPTDPRVAVVRIDRAADAAATEPLAVLTSFALHADTVGGTEYSADFPYYLGESLKKSLSAPAMHSLFAQGTCGDINHVDVSTDRPQKGHPEAERIGAALAEGATRAVRSSAALARPSLAVASVRVDLPVQQYPPDEVTSARALVAKIQDRKLPFLVGVKAVKIVKLYDVHRGQPIPTMVQAVQLDRDTALVFLPSEIFVELGLSIRQRSPYRNTIVVELANEAFGYVPTRRAFAEGNYEPTNSVLESGAGEALADAAVAALNNLAHAHD